MPWFISQAEDAYEVVVQPRRDVAALGFAAVVAILCIFAILLTGLVALSGRAVGLQGTFTNITLLSSALLLFDLGAVVVLLRDERVRIERDRLVKQDVLLGCPRQRQSVPRKGREVELRVGDSRLVLQCGDEALEFAENIPREEFARLHRNLDLLLQPRASANGKPKEASEPEAVIAKR